MGLEGLSEEFAIHVRLMSLPVLRANLCYELENL